MEIKELFEQAKIIHESFISSNPFVYKNGSKEYFKDGLLHNENGPAIDYINGDKAWFINGVKHRTDGPAVDYYNGYKVWYNNGIIHRSDGPAWIWSDGKEEYFINGREYKKKEYLRRIKMKELFEQAKIELDSMNNEEKLMLVGGIDNRGIESMTQRWYAPDRLRNNSALSELASIVLMFDNLLRDFYNDNVDLIDEG